MPHRLQVTGDDDSGNVTYRALRAGLKCIMNLESICLNLSVKSDELLPCFIKEIVSNKSIKRLKLFFMGTVD